MTFGSSFYLSMSKVQGNLASIPSYLSGITFGSGEIINLNIGWDFEELKWTNINPIIHLFDKNGKRLDLISLDKTSSQGIKIIDSKGSHYVIELNMNKLPNYIDSIYLSIGSINPDNKLDRLRDFYLQLNQGKESEVWGMKESTIPSSTMLVASFERMDPSFSPESKNKWDFNFLASELPPDYTRIHSILNKKDLFELPEESPSFLEKVSHKIINFFEKLIT